MRYPLEWWGEGRDARLLAAMDIQNGKIYTVRVMLTTAGLFSYFFICLLNFSTQPLRYSMATIHPKVFVRFQRQR